MRHLPLKHRGFTLVELLVVIAIIGTLVALLLPAVQSARESARSNTCKNNLRQLPLAATAYDSSLGNLPGYINDLENPRSRKDSNGQYEGARQASWVVMLLPYLEQRTLYDQWANASDPLQAGSIPQLEILICPSNEPEFEGTPHLAYVANAGRAFSDSTRSGPTSNRENAANGVFVDKSVNVNAVPSGATDGRESAPVPQTSINYLSSNDGVSNTLMFSESLYSFFWTYVNDNGDPIPLPPNTPSSLGEKAGSMADDKMFFGFVWANGGVEDFRDDNCNANFQKINGIPFGDEYAAEISSMLAMSDCSAYPSSNHPSGVNAAFSDGRVVYLNDTIDPGVYAQLMTSNARRSDLVVGGVRDAKLPPVSSDQF